MRGKIAVRSPPGKLEGTILVPMWNARKSLGRLCLATLGIVVLTACTDRPEPESTRVLPERRELTGYLPSSVGESSGVAVSRRHDGVVWTHNDSGHENLLYAINLQGDLRGTFRVRGAASHDWEDIALGRCPARDGDCLYIADTGDNLFRRETAAIYVIPEPDLPAIASGSTEDTEAARRFDFRYSDGPQDVEAMAVSPTGNVLFVTKGQRNPIRAYVVSQDGLLGNEDTVARATSGSALTPMRLLGHWVTGAAVSPAGNRVVVRTYTELFFFRLDSGVSLMSEGEPCFMGFIEPQGEGVDFLSEETVVLTSETLRGRPGPITLVTCPT